MAPNQQMCIHNVHKINGNNPFNNIWIMGEAILSTFTENVI